MSSRQDPVNWLLGNRELLVVLFAVVAWLFNRAAAAKRKAAARPAPSSPAQAAEEEAGRTRRVQEEIRRKLAERRAAGSAPAPGSGGEPLVLEQTSAFEPPQIEEELEPSPAAPPTRAQAREMEEVLSRQQGLERQMRALEATRVATAAALKSDTAFPPGAVAQLASSAAAPASPWLIELRHPSSVRRAIVLREILGPPVGLR